MPIFLPIILVAMGLAALWSRYAVSHKIKPSFGIALVAALVSSFLCWLAFMVFFNGREVFTADYWSDGQNSAWFDLVPMVGISTAIGYAAALLVVTIFRFSILPAAPRRKGEPRPSVMLLNFRRTLNAVINGEETQIILTVHRLEAVRSYTGERWAFVWSLERLHPKEEAIMGDDQIDALLRGFAFISDLVRSLESKGTSVWQRFSGDLAGLDFSRFGEEISSSSEPKSAPAKVS